MNIYTIYYNTLDYPSLYVSRRFKDARPTLDVFSHRQYEVVRDWTIHEMRVKFGIDPTPIKRNEADEPTIVECWL